VKDEDAEALFATYEAGIVPQVFPFGEQRVKLSSSMLFRQRNDSHASLALRCFSALAIVAFIIVILLVSLVQGHKQLRSVQKQLDQANEQIVQARAATVELEKSIANLKTKLDAADKKLTELQGNAT
jgi:septal ring factor EnvC (AmiA/AmiB activator)